MCLMEDNRSRINSISIILMNSIGKQFPSAFYTHINHYTSRFIYVYVYVHHGYYHIVCRCSGATGWIIPVCTMLCIYTLFPCGVFPCSVFACDLVPRHPDNEPVFSLLGPYGLVLSTCGILTANIENEHGHSFQHAIREGEIKEYAIRKLS